MRLMILPPLLLLFAGACAPFPELDAIGPDTASPPRLLPIDDVLAQAGTETADPGPALLARAQRAKLRAAAIAATPPAP